MLINGHWLDASDGAKFESANPATGKAWARIVWVNTYRAISPIARPVGLKIWVMAENLDSKQFTTIHDH